MPDTLASAVTFLFTDIEGSTRLWEARPEAMRLALERHDAIVRSCIEAHGGRVFKTIGDAFCSAFSDAPGALRAALAAQEQLGSQAAEGIALKVRMALHSGPADLRDGDYFGPTVNRVARLLAAGHGGQVLLAGSTARQVDGALPDGAGLRDLGEHRLKDLAQPERVFELQPAGPPVSFPPLRSDVALTHNLPVQLTSFIGRTRELAEVRRLLATTRLLTLTGSGGTGKTRLALEVAAALLEENQGGEIVQDGCRLVRLEAMSDPSLVPEAVAEVLGVREEPERNLKDVLADHLKSRRFLLIVDNCEHLLDACAVLADGLLRGCPGLTVLATSRQGLGIAGEQTYRVPSLSLPEAPEPGALIRSEAATLFAERARLGLPGFALEPGNSAAVAQICRQLDGIPLAIELAAARVRALPPQRIAERLDDRLSLLTGGSRTALPRQQTLQATIDWSYDLLSESERTLLRRLSVFAGGWSLEAAEAVAAEQGSTEDSRTGTFLHANEVLDLLASLVDKSLIVYEERAGDARYRLLESVRHYGRELLDRYDETGAVRGRHARYFLQLAMEGVPDRPDLASEEWLGRIELEDDNIRAALDWCRGAGAGGGGGRGEPERRLGVQLVAAVWSFWYIRSHLEEGSRMLEAALSEPEGAPASALMEAYTGAGGMAWLRGDYALAASRQQEALRVAESMGDPRRIAIALNNLGGVYYCQGDHEGAAALFTDSLRAYAEAGDSLGEANELNSLAEIARARNDLDTARALYEESLVHARRFPESQLYPMVLHNLAEVVLYQGDLARAETLHRESLARMCRVNDPRWIALSVTRMAGVYAATGDAERGARLLGWADALRARLGAHLEPNDRADYERHIAAAREALSQESFQSAWDEGQAMTLEQAIALAAGEEATGG